MLVNALLIRTYPVCNGLANLVPRCRFTALIMPNPTGTTCEGISLDLTCDGFNGDA